MAKLKMNVLQFYWGMGGPWTEFSYGGKKAEIIYPKESGFCAWAWNSGTAKTVKVGRECFPQDVPRPAGVRQGRRRRRRPTAPPASSSARSFATPTSGKFRCGWRWAR